MVWTLARSGNLDFGLCLGDVVGLDFGEVRECALATFEADATNASHTWESRAGSLANWWERGGSTTW